MSNLVKYHNEINNIPLRNLSENEINLFFSLILKAKDQGTNTIEVKFTELKKISNGYRDNERFYKNLEGLSTKLLRIIQRVEFENKVMLFTIFNRFIIDKENSILEIKINDDLKYLFNDLDQYTQFELLELVSLKSSYSKTAFRLLKQISKNNFRLIKLEDFKRILCIPNAYKMCDIDKKVLNPIIKELTPLYPNLKVEKIKEGRKIARLNFTWKKEPLKIGECLTHEVEQEKLVISYELNRAIEKTKKNRFIKPLMSDRNIQRLLNKFGDQQLTKGLYLADKKINIEIKSLNYIITTIENSLKENQLKIVVEKSEPNELESVEPKVEKKKEPIREIREVKKIEEYTENEILKAMEICFKEEETSLKFLEELRKKSTPIFFKTIDKYLK